MIGASSAPNIQVCMVTMLVMLTTDN